MNKLNMKFILLVLFLTSQAFAVEMGIPVQLRLKDPGGLYPTGTGDFIIQILSPSSCVLREETFSSQVITAGNISIALGTGARGPKDPNISLNSAYSNVAAKTGLTCVDVNNNITGTGQSYSPAATDTRSLRVIAVIGPDTVVADFNQRSVPYALQAESVGGKLGADIIVQNAATQMSQTNLDDLLLDISRFNNLKNIAVNGLAANATTAVTATTANNFSGSLTGDVTGTQSATVVSGLRGVTISAVAPTSGQVLVYNGTQYAPSTPTAVSAPVTSVNGQTGAVNLTVANISGALSASSSFTGDVTGNASATVVSLVGGKTSAQVATSVNDTSSATAAVINGAIMRRDGSGNVAVNSMGSINNSTQNIYVFEGTNTNNVRIKAANSFSDYILTLPVDDGASGQILSTDGSGNLSWVNAAGSSGVVTTINVTAPISSTGGSTPTLSISMASGLESGYLLNADWITFNNKMNATSAAVIAALGYTPADNAATGNYVLKANNLSDLASSSTARTNLGLGGAAILNVGVSAGTVAAGDDSRITNALSQAAFNAYVAGAICTTSQTMYWNSVSSLFACQNILVSGDVTGNASATTVAKIQGVGVSITALANNNILQYNGTNYVNREIPTCSANEYLTFNGSAWSCVLDAGVSGTITSISVTGPISSTGGSTPTLSIAQASGSANGYLASSDWTVFNNKMNATSAAVVAALGFTPADNAALGNYLVKANDLSDLASSATARINLGLAGAALLNVGTTAGTVAAGDDSRITNALSTSTVHGGDVSGTYNNLVLNNSGVAASTYTKVVVDTKGRVTSGTSLASVDVTAALGYTPASSTVLGNYLVKANDLSDLASSATARINLGLAGAALLNVGTTAGTVAAGDDSRITGALSQAAFNAYVAGAECTSSQTMYWNSVSGDFQCQDILISGDVTGNASTTVVTKIQGVAVSSTAPVAGQALVYNGSSWVPTTGMPAYSRLSGSNYTNTGTTYTNINNLNFNVTAGVAYKFRFNVIFSIAGTTRALRFLLGTPAVTTVAAQATMPSSTSTTGTFVIAAQSGTATAATNVSGGQVLISIVEGIVVPSASGVMQLQASLSGGGTTLTIYQGSTVEFIQVP